MKTPDATQAMGIVAASPFGLEIVERLGDRQLVPIVNDVEQTTARVAGNPGFVDGIGRFAAGGDAALIRDVGFLGDRNGSLLRLRHQAI